MKKNNGITLVALVLIIIILIILAGVAISTLINNGIIDKAKTATQEYKNAQDYEETQIAKYSNDIEELTSTRTETVNVHYPTIDVTNKIADIVYENSWDGTSCSYTATDDCYVLRFN